MKLTGNLKKQVEQTDSKEEARKVIEQAGMELTDNELDQAAGGWRGGYGGDPIDPEEMCRSPISHDGRHKWRRLTRVDGAMGPEECEYCHKQRQRGSAEPH